MSHIRRNMKEENTEYRPEQMLCAEHLRALLGDKYTVTLEKPLENLEPLEDIKMTRCIPDIMITGNNSKIVIRLMGAIHEKPKKVMKDLDQRLVLEHNGWKVVDFWYFCMPELWNPKKYTDKDVKDCIIREFKW